MARWEVGSHPDGHRCFLFNPHWTMETTILRVTPDDYNEEDVMRLFREGKLFTEVEHKLPTRDDVKRELLEYVSRIQECCNPQFKDSHERIWLDIFNSDDFDLVMKKGARRGELNKYRVMALVTYLFNNNLYNGSRSPLQLYYKLENTTKKGSIYTSSGNDEYAVQDRQRETLNKVIKKYNKA